MSLASELPARRAASPPGLWRRLRTVADEGWRYLLASLFALAVDFGLLVFLTEIAGLNYLVSAAIGFTAGLAVTYAISVKMIFKQHRLGRGAEVAAFIVVGILGLGLNELLLRVLVGGLGLHYALAKIPAAGASFVFNFTVRRLLIFSANGRSTQPLGDG